MLNVRHGWRILFALGVIPSMLQLAVFHWLPESPVTMIIRGKDEVARETYKRVYRDATPEIIELKLRVARNYVEATTQLQRGLTWRQRIKKVWTHGPYRRAIITVSGLQMFTQLTGFNTLLYYSGQYSSCLALRSHEVVILMGRNIVRLVWFYKRCSRWFDPFRYQCPVRRM